MGSTSDTIRKNVIQLLCKLGWHDWGKWQRVTLEIAYPFDPDTYYTNIPATMEVDGQERYCIRCNKSQTIEV
jgi:hypothetical protein